MTASVDRPGENAREPGSLRAKARLALARRDLLEFIRDRRTLFVTLLLPMAMYPILALSSALGVRTALSDIDSRAAPTNLVVVFTGSPWDAQALAERMGGLPKPEEGRSKLDWPASVSFGFGSAEEARSAVEAGQADLWIDVPEQVLDQLDGDGTISIEAQGSDTNVLPPRVRDQFTAVMRGLADDARRRRIDRAGLPESLLDPIDVRFTGKMDPPGTISTRSILPTAAGGVFVLLAVLTMTGAFYPAIDAIAGEKERGTIETLLIAPCAAIDIVAGKFLAVWAVALATLVANVVSIALTTAVSIRFLPQGGKLLPEGHLPIVVGVSLLAFIGLSAVAAAMCLAVTTASKSGKEAQNTLTPVLLMASALAGAGLVIDLGRNPLLPAVPFAGQVAVARATLEPDEQTALLPSATMEGSSQSRPAGLPERIAATGLIERLALPLAVSLISSAVLVWLMLQVTANLLTDEEILFRGPDVAGNLWSRPARRRRPSIAQGFTALAVGLAGLWYAQGIAPTDFALAIPVQQAAAVVLPLVLLMAWQRVDLRRTFGLRWPVSAGGPAVWRTVASVVGAMLVGGGLFVLGAAVLLAVRGTHVSAEAQSLAEKLLAMMRDRPIWLSWALIAVLPAIGEELLFRGWVQSALVGAWPSRGRLVAGVVAQAACFAVFHLLPERMPQTFALGLVAGVLTVATRSLLPAIACHAAHNSMPLWMLWLAGGLSASPESLAAAKAAATGLSRVAMGAAMIWLAVRGRAEAGLGGLRARRFLAVCTIGLVALGGRVGADSVAAAESAPDAAIPQEVRVAVLPMASAVEWEGDQPTGVIIDIWHDLAQRIGLETDFIRADTFRHVLERVARGEVDVGLGPIAITEERERLFDLTHPIAHSGLRVAVGQQDASGFLSALRSLFSWQLLELLGTVLLLALASGHLLWWFEHRSNPESFPPQYPRGMWEAIWWIASTVVAGGCDNKHVASGLGRTIAFAWMVGGIVLLAAFTSVLTATLTAEQVAGKIHGPKDLVGRTVGCQESAVSVKEVRRRGGVAREYAKLDEALDMLQRGELDAVVGENQQMMFLLNQSKNAGLKLVGPIFEAFDYGFGLPNGSPLRERLNTAILRMREDGTMERIREQWLGRHD
ncbi:MAG: transporter substrate-binding domain-containing protein [Planctomycetia bacterium]|nr:transporter substrate-binding domain-containing protein [Planctomycetia bacterium]